MSNTPTHSGAVAIFEIKSGQWKKLKECNVSLRRDRGIWHIVAGATPAKFDAAGKQIGRDRLSFYMTELLIGTIAQVNPNEQ